MYFSRLEWLNSRKISTYSIRPSTFHPHKKIALTFFSQIAIHNSSTCKLNLPNECLYIMDFFASIVCWNKSVSCLPFSFMLGHCTAEYIGQFSRYLCVSSETSVCDGKMLVCMTRIAQKKLFNRTFQKFKMFPRSPEPSNPKEKQTKKGFFQSNKYSTEK